MSNSLFAEKYYDDEIEEENLYPWEHVTKNGYGFVCVKNPHYMTNGDEREFFIRKPTPAERRDIIVNTIIECNGRTFRIPDLAKRLGVSDRTVQIVLRELEREKLIEITPKKTRRGAQRGNAYRYIGPPCEKYGSGLTLQVLYDAEHNVGFRDWDWRAYGFAQKSKMWHTAYPRCYEKFMQHKERRKYLEKNNLPLVVPEKIKYLVLRHCYWKGNKWWLKKFLFSNDGAVKLPLFPLGRTETMTLYGYTMSVIFGGEAENPQVTIINSETGEQLAVFTWFDEYVIEGKREIDARHIELFFILGDFTTK